jgi:Fe2+ or Zn2+ uptake regulation protein
MTINLIEGYDNQEMAPEQGESAALFERLVGTGIRPTRQRLLVLETLAAEPHDATAQEIHARLRERGERVGLATVYRSLAVLREKEVVDELVHHAGETCYRLCGPGHHHHLVCSSCIASRSSRAARSTPG